MSVLIGSCLVEIFHTGRTYKTIIGNVFSRVGKPENSINKHDPEAI